MISARHLGKTTALCSLALAVGLGSAAVAAPAPSAHRNLTNAGVRPAWYRSASVLHDFDGTDGSAPVGNLDLSFGAGASTLYGVTEGGGINSAGTIFTYALGSKKFASLYAFADGNDGANPAAGLANNDLNVFPAGFYQLGVAINGGTGTDGTVFALSPTGVLAVIHAFTGGLDGSSPAGRLTLFTDGNYYGTTSSGGEYGYGTVYRITPSGAFSTIYQFTGGADGGAPQAGLELDVTLGHHGALTPAIVHAGGLSKAHVKPYLYGTTSTGGADLVGTIFRISPGGHLETLYTFTGGLDGGVPAAKLTTDFEGDLFGSTTVGGVDGNGVIFELARYSATPFVLHDFGDGSTGANPQAQLTFAYNGNLYGTTTAGGASGVDGNVFEITPNGAFHDVHDFSGIDGANPQGALTDGGNGFLYGTTVNGGAFGQGTLFAIPTY